MTLNGTHLLYSLNDDFNRAVSDVPLVLGQHPLGLGTQESKYDTTYAAAAENNGYGLRQRMTSSATRGVAVFWDRGQLTAVGATVDEPASLGWGWQQLLSGDGNDLEDRGIVWQDVQFIGGHRRFRLASTHRPPPRDDHLWPAFDAALIAWIRRSPVRVWIAMDCNQHGGPDPVVRATSTRWYGVDFDGGLTNLRIDDVSRMPVAHSDHDFAVGNHLAGADPVATTIPTPTTTGADPTDDTSSGDGDTDLDLLMRHLHLRDLKGGKLLDVIAAVVAPPMQTLTMDGASTLEVVCADYDRVLTRSEALQQRSWARVDDIRFELVSVSKAGDRVTLTYEDGIAGALRRRTSPLAIPAGSTTRSAIVARFCKEARVPYVVDPAKRPNVATAVTRSAHGEERSSSWDVSGTLASDVDERRFSDGHQLLFGGDDWLLGRSAPVMLRENAGAVTGSIDFDLDVGKPASEANLTVDVAKWVLRPGGVVALGDEMGPAGGKWLVSEFVRPLTSTSGTVKLVRGRHALKEPKPRKDDSDPGSSDYLPTTAGTAGSGTAANRAREAMVRYALAQSGKPYIWGGHGPDGYDCSGLVEEATRAAGRALSAPSALQAAACGLQGKNISIADGLATRGALLFRIGTGEYNHVVISLGNGSTVEARGHAYPIGVFGGAADGGWTTAALWL